MSSYLVGDLVDIGNQLSFSPKILFKTLNISQQKSAQIQIEPWFLPLALLNHDGKEKTEHVKHD